MNLMQKKELRKSIILSDIDPNEDFVRTLCLGYMGNIFIRHPKWDSDTLTFLLWLLQDRFTEIIDIVLTATPKDDKDQVLGQLGMSVDNDDKIRVISNSLLSWPKRRLNSMQAPVSELLLESARHRRASSRSTLASNLVDFTKLFGLTNDEADVCIFLAVMASWSPVERYFDTHLDCDRLSGRKYILAALKMTNAQFTTIISGRLRKLGFIDADRRWLELSSDCLPLLNDSVESVLSRDHYGKLPKPSVGLDSHSVPGSDLGHLNNLLEKKHNSATHVLFYGTPGTGKTSFARALAASIDGPAYEVLNNTENKSMGRRLGLTACLNLTNHGQGSLVVVDEADGILNTDDGWFMRGESQDKGWLNDLLEEPGSRVIWITNRVDNIDPSVRRRFAYSLFFPPFGRRQREAIWESILRKHKVKRHFSQTEIQSLASEFEVSAGAIDIAVSKARETSHDSRGDLLNMVKRSLAAHLSLIHNGRPVRDADAHDKNYVREALNLNYPSSDLVAQVKRFDNWWRQPLAERPVRNLNLLFHGPSGTGKTELARHLAHELDRPLAVKRMSDLLGPYVGQTEQALARVFAQAEADEAILLIDEADSLLFPRSRAQKSWEISSTNEFLTQMERFRGILICTTNRVTDLDDASLRRFSRKIEFGYLKPAGVLALYDRLLAPLAGGLLTGSLRREVSQLDFLTPGMFKIVREETLMNFGFTEHKVLVSDLKREAKMIADRQGKMIGFASKMEGTNS